MIGRNNNSTSKVFAAAVGIAAMFLAYLWWPNAAPSAAAIKTAEYGEESRASLVAVEPFLTPQAYRSADALRRELEVYLEQARARGWITSQSIIVFPEHVGTWLVAADAPPAVYRARFSVEATATILMRHPIAILKARQRSQEANLIAAALFRARSGRMAADYQAVFSGLAREFQTTVVAGSIVLENPIVKNGVLIAGDGPLYNVSAVFKPDGSIESELVFKRHPIPSEATFIRAGDVALPTFDTPAGKLGVLVCADSWHPEAYEEIADADVVAVPAYLQADGGWSESWGGYVTPPPEDVAEADKGTIQEGDAWRKYSMPARIGATNARAGVTSFLRGRIWDLGADGRMLAKVGETAFVGDAIEGGSVSVVWY